MLHGKRELKLLNHGETYEFKPPKLSIKFLPVPKTEWAGTQRIQCKETDLEAEFSYGKNHFQVIKETVDQSKERSSFRIRRSQFLRQMAIGISKSSLIPNESIFFSSSIVSKFYAQKFICIVLIVHYILIRKQFVNFKQSIFLFIIIIIFFLINLQARLIFS